MFIPDAATFNSRASALVHWPEAAVERKLGERLLNPKSGRRMTAPIS
jgi:hypothetical protein